MKIIYTAGEGEVTEKKSRFIATVRPVTSQEEAESFILEMKKKYWDARHNCYAWILGERGESQRASDDGEPQGTAGKPMLAVLTGMELTNVCVVVTRYFGGVLLGTGGLVRAYSAATQAGLENSVVLEKIPGYKVTIGTDYNGIGKIQYILMQNQHPILDTEYTDIVKVTALVPEEEMGKLTSLITEATAARAAIEQEAVCFGYADGEAVIL